MTDILQQLAALAGPVLKSPQGQQMAQAIMAQLQGGGGGDPRAAMAQNPMGPPTGQDQTDVSMANGRPVGRGPVTDMEVENMDRANSNVSGQPTQMSTEDELAAAHQAMGNQGGVPNTGGMNSDGPTPQEIQLLKSSPTPRNVANFDKLFGPGAAEQVLGGGGTTYEDDVRASMPQPHSKGESDYNDNQGHDDEGDHEYR